MSAVSELKRNLPDLASTLVRSPSSSISSYPLHDERTPPERYLWDHRGEFESARELAELRQQNKHLGEAIAWILETLNREADDRDGQEALDGKRKQSLESLSYVRDILSGQINEVDERRLWGEEEFKRRWEEARETSPTVAARKLGPRDNRRSTTSTPNIPLSVNETLRGFISSKTLATSDHNRSSGTPAVSRATLPRAPARVLANNPFQRVSSGGGALQGQWSAASNRTVVSTSEGSGDVRKQVPQDPLGVLG